MPEVLPLVRELYAKGNVGCCLHIILDDGNIGDDSVRFCIGYAQREGHQKCEALAQLILQMSRTQRLKLWACSGP